ncbi:MAG: hypothetical protein HMLKMBBP_01843 [Planctomycetes bacterium]|nr:hypothetical protein [Planctomycetota bacterium]
MSALVSPRMLERAARLEPVVRRAAGGRRSGERGAGAAGIGTVFHEHRPYAPGDDVRYVDWNAWARLRTRQVKLFEREESLDLHVLLDRSASMGGGRGSKLEVGARAAALVGAAAIAHGDVVRLRLLPSGGTATRGIAGRDGVPSLAAALAAVEPGATTPLGAALREVFPELRRRGAALLVTDFLASGGDGRRDGDGAGGWRRAIDFLVHRRVELTCLHVVADEELHPPDDGPLRLRDVETGEEAELDVDDAVRDAYAERFRRHLREVESYVRAKGARHVVIDASRAGEADLLRALLRAGVLR